jgi:hypothetical protein
MSRVWRRRIRVAVLGIAALAWIAGCELIPEFDEGEPSLELTGTAGGETWDIGAEYRITWGSENLDHVRVELSRDGGATWETLAGSVPALSGGFSWVATGAESTECVVRISDADHDRVSATSPGALTLKMVPPQITTHPADQAVVENETATFSVVGAGSGTFSYRWQEYVDSAWQDISGATGASYTTSSLTLADDGRRFRCEVTNAGGSVTSDPATLTVIPLGTLTVLSPDGGEAWAVGSSQEITWKSSAVAKVKIEFSRDGGVTWNDVVASADASLGSYPWTVTGPVSADCLVKVSDTAGGTSPDESDAAFSIAGITVTSPNAGEEWYFEGADQEVTWTSAGAAGTVDIHYSTDGGTG